ncbi:MAG: TetR/AcrR family transcriptional regulator, partial [Bdellovibrionales bacterium]|nr:TetR/AcrR family transcriptional regulator [Bdellovibrionales bacterium]
MSSKEKMILAALDLFHSRGVNATGISEVLKRSKTGKGQFTHYFKNKDGLIREVVSYLIEVIRSGQAGTGYDIKDWVELEGWFESYIV